MVKRSDRDRRVKGTFRERELAGANDMKVSEWPKPSGGVDRSRIEIDPRNLGTLGRQR